MRLLLLAMAVYVAAVLQTTLVDAMRIGAVAPDLLTLVAVVWPLALSGPYGFLGAGLVGLAGDLVGPGRIGPGAVGMLAVGYALGRGKARFGLEHWLVQLPLVAAATVAFGALLGLTRWLLGEVSLGPLEILRRALGVGLYTAAVSLPLLLAIGWIREPHRARHKTLAEF
jgi:rod shape-determining protein MreD